MCGAIHPLPQYALTEWCSVKKHRDNFTFNLPILSGLFLNFRFPTKTFTYLPLRCAVRTLPTRHPCFEHRNNVTWQFKLWSSLVCSLLQLSVTSSLLDTNISLSSVFLKTLRMRDQVSQIKLTKKIWNITETKWILYFFIEPWYLSRCSY